MALPLLPEIRKKHPDATITWLCGTAVYPLLRQFKDIDELIVVNEVQLLKGGVFGRLFEILKVWKKLTLRTFDLQLYYYFSSAYKLLILPARFREVRSFNKNPKNRINPHPVTHHTFGYVNTFLNLEGPFQLEIQYPPYQFEVEAYQDWRKKLGTQKVVVFSSGGAQNFLRTDELRRYPMENYVKIAEMLVSRGYLVVLSGGKNDEWVAEHFAHLPVENRIGQMDLNHFIAFLKVADLLITHDTGPLHLADLAWCPVVAMFGPTNPSNVKSLNPASVHLWGGAHLHCRPCYDGREYAKCPKNICMDDLVPEKVVDAVLSVLEKVPSGFPNPAG